MDFFMFWLVRPIAEFVGYLLLTGVFLVVAVAIYVVVELYKSTFGRRK